MIKAHIICKESNKIASCNPVLKPHTKYDSSYDFWVFKSIQNALEFSPLEKGEHIMAIMAEDWFKMVRKLNKNAEAGLSFESPVKEDFLSYCPSLTKNLSMADHYNQNPNTKEDF